MRGRRPPEPFVFFVDECLGGIAVVDALTAALEDRETIRAPEKATLDEDWLPEAGREGWICLSKDRAMKRRANHLEAILHHGVALFMLGEANGAEHARRVVTALPTMRRLARSTDLAFVARIEPECDLTLMYAAGRQLERTKRVKQKIRERQK